MKIKLFGGPKHDTLMTVPDDKHRIYVPIDETPSLRVGDLQPKPQRVAVYDMVITCGIPLDSERGFGDGPKDVIVFQFVCEQ